MRSKRQLRLITVAVMPTVVLSAEVVLSGLAGLRKVAATLFLVPLEETVRVAPRRRRDLIARLKQVDLTLSLIHISSLSSLISDVMTSDVL